MSREFAGQLQGNILFTNSKNSFKRYKAPKNQEHLSNISPTISVGGI